MIGESRFVSIRGRSPFVQGILLLSAALVAVLLLPLLLLVLLAMVLIGGRAALIGWWRNLRRPNGVLDGRRNVRVKVPGPERT